MKFTPSLSEEFVEEALRRVRIDPIVSETRELPPRPCHVLYGGAHLFAAEAPEKIGARARQAMETWGNDDGAFGQLVGVEDSGLASEVAKRVRDKLARSPVESMCIDFEDGYGPRGDEEEDKDASRAALELAARRDAEPWVGIRIKALSGATSRRAVRTLDRFVTTFAHATDGALRPNFTVTLPKVTGPDEVAVLALLLDTLESTLGAARIGVELMIESPRALFDARGSVAIPALIEAGRGRVTSLHLGAYDLTAELGVTAEDQRLDHPFCDLARMLLQVAVTHAHARVGVSDGATTLLPIAVKDASSEENAAAIHRAWRAHASNIRRAMDFGIWQGWDLHPAQLPIRYGAVFAYFLTRREALGERLRRFLERAAQASRVGQVFDDAATGQGLLNFFDRGLACGAFLDEDLRASTLTRYELQTRSFERIARARAAAPRPSGTP